MGREREREITMGCRLEEVPLLFPAFVSVFKLLLVLFQFFQQPAQQVRTGQLTLPVRATVALPEQEEKLGSRDEKPGSNSRDSLVAVCVTGQMRSFLDPRVQSGFLNNFHKQGSYVYFLSIDERLTVGDARIQIPSVQKVFTDAGGGRVTVKSQPGEGDCPLGTKMHLFMFPYVMRFVPCYHAMKEYERLNSIQFTHVTRVRPDTLFLKPFPHVKEMLENHGRGKDMLLFDDQFGITSRRYARILLVAPSMAYRACHDSSMWARACSKPIQKVRRMIEGVGHAVPCCPMNMIVNYDPYVSVRQCGFIGDRKACGLQRCTMDLLRVNATRGKYGCS